MKRISIVLVPAVVWAIAAPGHASTIVMKDGSVVEGDIITETSSVIRVRTLFDVRSLRRRDIDKIYDAGGSSAASTATAEFEALPAGVQALLNARAEYKLGKYQRVLDRLKPYVERPADAPNQSEVRWLVIESQERLSRWETATKMLKEIEKDGGYADQIRAKAHLSIFENNPRYDLRVVGQSFARNFLNPDLVVEARTPGALADVRIMRAALSEYCDQLLRNDKTSIEAFEGRLNVRATIEAIRKLPKGADPAKVLEGMPYYADLRKTEQSIYKAQAVLPGYATTFVMNLVRAEVTHLLNVLIELINEAEEVSPYRLTLQKDRRTGRLSADARRQWQEACDTYLARTNSTLAVADYVLEKTNPYQKQLSEYRKLVQDFYERITQMRQSVARRRNRAT